MSFTDTAINHTIPGDKPINLIDSGGLILLDTATGVCGSV